MSAARHALARLGVLALAAFAGVPARAAEPPAKTLAAIAASRAAPLRRALIVAPDLLTGPTAARNAVAQADATRYGDLLRLLGFDVTTVKGATRLELSGAVKTFAETVNGADVAVFVLGTVRPKGDALYVFPAGDTPPPDVYATEGLALGRLLEPILARGPRETVVVVDECRNEGAACRAAATAVPDNVSVVVGLRPVAGASDAPRAGLASLETEMAPLMQREGLAYLDLFAELKARLAGTNMSVAAGPSLTRSFAFLPAGFLAQLDIPCNRVDPDAGAEVLRQGAAVAPLVPACEHAAATWSFSSHFSTRLAAAREEAAFQRAVAGCDPDAVGDFITTFPGSRLAPAVTEARNACETRDREAREREAQARETQARETQAREAQEARQREARDQDAREAREREARETPPAPADAGLTCTVGGLDPNGDNWLALRHGPNPRTSWSTTHMGPGTVVTAFEQIGQWMRVRLASGETGWASRRYLSCGSEAQIPPVGAEVGSCVVAGLDPAGNNWLALREEPNFKARWSVTQMGPGTHLTPIGRTGDWLHVRLRSGETGWANAHFVRCDG